jgi:eukaryotic-like serine/threonine-protein kinase
MAVSTGLLPERYANPEQIGRGGMGEIFRATDTALGRAVAIKVLDDRYAQDFSVRQRFTREALAVARLSGNPNIVTIYDVGEQGDRPFIVMEYLAGGSLEQKLREEGAQPPAQALAWLEQAANALDGAHRNGVVHRDVKPANLLLDVHGRVHVADFGIASAAGMQSLTQTGTVLGTASYLSPEQASGEATSAASDLYSLAVVAFELLTGHRPFEGSTIAEEAAAHVNADVPSVRSFSRRLPRELDAVFGRALSKEPAGRFTSGAEFVAALRAAFDHAAGATAIVAAPAPRRRGPSPKLLVLAAALILAGIAGAIAAALVSNDHGSKALPPARPSVSIRTVTETTPGSTIVTTAQAPTTAPTTNTTPQQSSDPTALNDQAYELMKQHNYAAALPLLQQAVQELQGQSSTVAGYANYNLGVTLIALGQCDSAMQYLDAAQQIEPERHEVHDAMKAARKCSGGNGNSD